MKRKIAVASFVMAFGLLQPGMVQSADMGPVDEPIKVAVDAWIGAQITSKVLGKLFEKQGYQVEYINVQSQAQFAGLETGDISVSPEVWAVFNPAAIEAEKAGRIIKVGDSGLIAYEGWYYPKFVEEQCPGIKSWETINECAAMLATPDTLPLGRFVDYPADWGVQDRNPTKIRTLNLDFVALPGGSEGATVAEVKRSLITKEPLVFMFYAPSWVHRDIELGKVEFPQWEEACDTDPAWGPNPDVVGDCDWMSNYPISKWMWPGFMDKWPAAYELFLAYQLTNDAQDDMAKLVEGEKMELGDVVDDWLEANKDLWEPWVNR